MANAAAERLPADRLVARRVEMAWDGLEAALATALHRAQAQGELSAEKDPRSLARFFLVFLQGLKLVSKTQSPPGRFYDAAKEALSLLD